MERERGVRDGEAIPPTEMVRKAAWENQLTLLEEALEEAGAAALLAQDSRNGRTALIAAARKRSTSKTHVQILRLLWERSGSEGRALVDVRGRSALHYLAAKVRGMRAARAVVEMLAGSDSGISGESVMARDSEGNTVLHCLALLRTSGPAFATIANFLIETAPKGALTAQNCRGETPLHVAAMRGHDNTLRVLLRSASPAEMLVLDSEGHSFLFHLHRHDQQFLSSIVKDLPLAVFEALPHSEAARRWWGVGGGNSLLQVCIRLRSDVLAPLLSTIVSVPFSGDSTRDVKWAVTVAYNLLWVQRFDLAESFVEWVGTERLHSSGPWTTPSPCQTLATMRSLYCTSDAVAAAVRIVETAPDHCFEEADPFSILLVKAMGNAHLHRDIFAAIARRTEITAELYEKVRLLLRPGHSAPFQSALLPLLPRKALTSDLLALLLELPGITDELAEEIVSLFPVEGIAAGTDDGETVLLKVVNFHALHKRAAVQCILEAAPQLRTVADPFGNLPLQLATERAQLYSSPDSDAVVALLQPKGAVLPSHRRVSIVTNASHWASLSPHKQAVSRIQYW